MTARKKNVGNIIIPPGIFVAVHEKITVDFLAVKTGYDITFLLPNRQPGHKTPDIKMDGTLWEMKSPIGKSSRTIENNLRAALTQSHYIIVDLRRMDGRIPTKRLLDEIERQFQLAKKAKRILVITRQEDIVDYKHNRGV